MEEQINSISIKKIGLAFGMTGALLYTACALIMLIFGHDGTVNFFNMLLHGIDVSTIIKMNVSLREELLGIVQTFIIGWLTGACIAIIYNGSFNKKIVK